MTPGKQPRNVKSNLMFGIADIIEQTVEDIFDIMTLKSTNKMLPKEYEEVINQRHIF